MTIRFVYRPGEHETAAFVGTNWAATISREDGQYTTRQHHPTTGAFMIDFAPSLKEAKANLVAFYVARRLEQS